MKPSPSAYWFAPPEERAPNGESFVDLCDRVADAVREIAKRQRGRDVVIVAHGGSIRAALAHACGFSPYQALQFSVRNLSLTRLENLSGQWRVGAVNEEPPGLSALH